jgi:hypothetical protein
MEQVTAKEKGASSSHERLRLPFKVEDVEYMLGKQRVWQVIDRVGVLVAIFPDQQLAKDVTESLNGLGKVSGEPR